MKKNSIAICVDRKGISLTLPEKFVDTVKDYPELSMMNVMEELSELSMAISKGIRNGSNKVKDNIAEEMVDVMIGLVWIANRYEITEDELAKWAKYKLDRGTERSKNDEVIFRTKEARKIYDTNVAKRIKTTVAKTITKKEVRKEMEKNVDKAIKEIKKVNKKDEKKGKKK